MKKILRSVIRGAFGSRRAKNEVLSEEQLKEKAVEGAKKAVKEYGRVFERLAEYDRT